MGTNQVSAAMNGGEWDCLKLNQIVRTTDDLAISFQMKLGRCVGGGVKKPTRGYQVALCRNRFGLGPKKIESITVEGPESKVYKNFKFDGLDAFAGDEVSVWVSVLPLGKGDVVGVIRNWKMNNSKFSLNTLGRNECWN